MEAFFLFGKAAFVQGIGEQLQPYESCPRWLSVVVPACHVGTAEIFAAPELTRNSKTSRIAGFAQAARQPVWAFGRNDLQAVTAARFPQVQQALIALAGRISAADMRAMNLAADAHRESPAAIVRRFLERSR